MVMVKNCGGILVISEAVVVIRSINCFFCSAVRMPLSIDMYGMIGICVLRCLIYAKDDYVYLVLFKNAAARVGEFNCFADKSSILSAPSSSDIETKNVISSARSLNMPDSLICFIAEIRALKKNFSPGKLL